MTSNYSIAIAAGLAFACAAAGCTLLGSPQVANAMFSTRRQPAEWEAGKKIRIVTAVYQKDDSIGWQPSTQTSAVEFELLETATSDVTICAITRLEHTFYSCDLAPFCHDVTDLTAITEEACVTFDATAAEQPITLISKGADATTTIHLTIR